MNTKANTALIAEPPVWFITGCSTGFGMELAKQAIQKGYRTVMTARDPAPLEGYGATDNVLVLKLDVTQADQIEAAMAATKARFGGIDVLVNNAGIGYFAAIEEGEDAEVRKMFEVNVFGLSRVIQAVLPGMRKRRTGCIVNFSSIGGIRAFPAIGYYNATKFAVEGLSEALWKEIEPLGLRVMLVSRAAFAPTGPVARPTRVRTRSTTTRPRPAPRGRRCAHRPASSLGIRSVPPRPSSRR